MEKVSVKLVMFKQKTVHEEGEYCGYCPALGAFHVMDSFERLRAYMQRSLDNDVAGRIHYKSLTNLGWDVSENYAKPPIFADEELIRLTEEAFAVKIKEPIIVELYAELTPPRDPYAHLFPHKNS